MFLKAEKQPQRLLLWEEPLTLFRNSEVGLEGEAKGSSFLASKLELVEVLRWESPREPLSQIPLQGVVRF